MKIAIVCLIGTDSVGVRAGMDRLARSEVGLLTGQSLHFIGGAIIAKP
jgi:hypothetical protein